MKFGSVASLHGRSRTQTLAGWLEVYVDAPLDYRAEFRNL